MYKFFSPYFFRVFCDIVKKLKVRTLNVCISFIQVDNLEEGDAFRWSILKLNRCYISQSFLLNWAK